MAAGATPANNINKQLFYNTLNITLVFNKCNVAGIDI